MGQGRFSRPLRGVGVFAMPDAGLETTWLVESGCVVEWCAGGLRLVEPGVVVGRIIDHCCVADGVHVTL
jgi:hypothetical protein